MISVHHIYLRHAPSFGGSEHHAGSPYILSTPAHQAVVVVVVVVVVFVGVCFGHRHVFIGKSHRTGGTVYYGHRRVYDVRSRSHITGGTVCYWHRPVYVARSHITAGTICYWHRRVFVVRSHITGGGTICYGHRRVSVVRSHIRGGAICYGHRRLYVVSTRQGVRFVTSIGVCMLALPSPGPK